MLTLGIEVPVRDGVVLRGLHYAPTGGPAPVVLNVIPYGADRYHGAGVRFAERGFHFVSLDCRGRGDSDGEFIPFVSDGADGYDVIEWLGSRDWCDGAVVTYGGSYCGFNQWATAATRPSGLRAIAPVAAVYPGVDFPMVRNVPSQFAAQWLTLIAGHRMNNGPFEDDDLWKDASRRLIDDKLPFRDLDLVSVGRRLPTFQDWLDHPELDDYWAGLVPTRERYAAIDIPVLTITGQYDDDQVGALRYHDEHVAAVAAGQHHVVIGPWDHAGTRTAARSFGGLTFAEASEIDLIGLHADWFDWILGRGDRPSFLADRVVYFHVGEDRWRSGPDLPGTGAALDLYPDTDGRLARSRPESLTTELVLDPRRAGDPDREIPAEDSYFADATPLRAGITFTSDPLSEPVDLSGRPHALLTLSSDLPDFDLMISIHLLRDDAVHWLGETMFRARYHESLRHVTPWPAGEEVAVELTGFPFISRRLQPGDRLALVVRAPHRRWQPNFQTGGPTAEDTAGDARSGVVRIHPSIVTFP